MTCARDCGGAEGAGTLRRAAGLTDPGQSRPGVAREHRLGLRRVPIASLLPRQSGSRRFNRQSQRAWAWARETPPAHAGPRRGLEAAGVEGEGLHSRRVHRTLRSGSGESREELRGGPGSEVGGRQAVARHALADDPPQHEELGAEEERFLLFRRSGTARDAGQAREGGSFRCPGRRRATRRSAMIERTTEFRNLPRAAAGRRCKRGNRTSDVPCRPTRVWPKRALGLPRESVCELFVHISCR